ncbi:MAG: STAS domain-containing protein [Planctomycetota bacterium]|nr:STAS domain-containing protein [Planctomycetota bacterium]
MATQEELTIQKTTTENDVVVLTLAGSIGNATYGRLEAAINEVFATGNYSVILDVANVRYVSSSGAGVLMNAFLQARDNQGKLVLVRVPPTVANILELLNLQAILPVAADMPSALALFT